MNHNLPSNYPNINRHYLDEEDRYLLTNPDNLSINQLADKLGRSPLALGMRLYKLKADIRSGKQKGSMYPNVYGNLLMPHWPDKDCEKVVEMFKSGKSYTEIQRDFPDRTVQAIMQKVGRTIRKEQKSSARLRLKVMSSDTERFKGNGRQQPHVGGVPHHVGGLVPPHEEVKTAITGWQQSPSVEVSVVPIHDALLQDCTNEIAAMIENGASVVSTTIDVLVRLRMAGCTLPGGGA